MKFKKKRMNRDGFPQHRVTDVVDVDRSLGGVQVLVQHGYTEQFRRPSPGRRRAKDRWVRTRLRELGCEADHLPLTDERTRWHESQFTYHLETA